MASNKRASARKRTGRRQGRRINRVVVLVPVALVLLVGGIWLLAARDRPASAGESLQLPAWISARGPKARQAYTQTVVHRDELQYIPCYCGCGGVGHVSIVDCHIANVADDGSITYDQHAAT